jgi:hypothetical protein
VWLCVRMRMRIRVRVCVNVFEGRGVCVCVLISAFMRVCGRHCVCMLALLFRELTLAIAVFGVFR